MIKKYIIRYYHFGGVVKYIADPSQGRLFVENIESAVQYDSESLALQVVNSLNVWVFCLEIVPIYLPDNTVTPTTPTLDPYEQDVIASPISTTTTGTTTTPTSPKFGT